MSYDPLMRVTAIAVKFIQGVILNQQYAYDNVDNLLSEHTGCAQWLPLCKQHAVRIVLQQCPGPIFRLLRQGHRLLQTAILEAAGIILVIDTIKVQAILTLAHLGPARR